MSASSLLLEAVLVEDSKLHDDTVTGAYPSECRSIGSKYRRCQQGVHGKRLPCIARLMNWNRLTSHYWKVKCALTDEYLSMYAGQCTLIDAPVLMTSDWCTDQIIFWSIHCSTIVHWSVRWSAMHGLTMLNTQCDTIRWYIVERSIRFSFTFLFCFSLRHF